MLVRNLIIVCGIYAITAFGIATWVYFDALESSLADDRGAGDVRLSEAVSRLRAQLDIYRVLVNITAQNADMAIALQVPEAVNVQSELTQISLTYGAFDIDLVNDQGVVISASRPERNGFLYDDGLVRAALNGRLGSVIESENGTRVMRFSRRVVTSEGAARGAIVVSANLAGLEFEWPVTPEPVVFFDDRGVSMASNRPELLQHSNTESAEFPTFPLRRIAQFSGASLWQFGAGKELQSEVQTIVVDVPQIQMTAMILLDTSNARSIAMLRLGLAAALLVSLALIGAIFVQQRRRIALESSHSATLEVRVEERTSELKAAQDELVEASNLAALGRLSAGLSHELNQPLAAILNFAENGKRLLQRSRMSETSDNLSQIADQVRRTTRIIGNLRAFARQEHSDSEPIDITEVTRRALDLMQPELKESLVNLEASLPDDPVFVMAGKVRLEQVIVNLVSNAIDAMQDSALKDLRVDLTCKVDEAKLSVCDTGSGIKEPDRVFEPFYTTKELGSSKGLGMGLALSFGLVSRFGGTLTCENLESGAEFIMTLPILEDDQCPPKF